MRRAWRTACWNVARRGQVVVRRQAQLGEVRRRPCEKQDARGATWEIDDARQLVGSSIRDLRSLFVPNHLQRRFALTVEQRRVSAEDDNRRILTCLTQDTDTTNMEVLRSHLNLTQDDLPDDVRIPNLCARRDLIVQSLGHLCSYFESASRCCERSRAATHTRSSLSSNTSRRAYGGDRE